VLACVKHFAGYGAAEGGRDYDASYIPEVLFRNVYLVPFHAAEQAGAGSFMSAYMDLNDVPPGGNRWLFTDILRKECHRGSHRQTAHRPPRCRPRFPGTRLPASQARVRRPRRITLLPGQTRTLRFPLGIDELSFWSPLTRAWGVEPGTFDVWAGEDSAASLHAELVVTE
jgi:hypothetical protein